MQEDVTIVDDYNYVIKPLLTDTTTVPGTFNYDKLIES